VLILSVSEGDDKPLKYPSIFRKAAVLIINKIDLLGHGSFDLPKAMSEALSIQPQLQIFPLSAWKKEGLAPLIDWLKLKVAKRKADFVARLSLARYFNNLRKFTIF